MGGASLTSLDAPPSFEDDMITRFCKQHPFWGTLVFCLVVSVSILISKAFCVSLPPLLLSTLRVGFLFPLIFFISPPLSTPMYIHLFGGLLLGLGYYGCFYVALSLGAMPGIATLFSQLSIPLNILLAIPYLKVSPSGLQMLGVSIIVGGAVGISSSFGLQNNSSSLFWILVFLSLATIFQTFWQLFMKKHITSHFTQHLIWQCALATPVLSLLSCLIEGPELVITSLRTLQGREWLVLMILSLVGTLFSGAFLLQLLRFHNPATILPTTALIPCFVMGFSYVLFEERLTALQIVCALVIVVGVYITQRYRYKAANQNQKVWKKVS